eukprot:298947_1
MAGILLIIGDTGRDSDSGSMDITTTIGIILAMTLLGGGLFTTIQLKDAKGHTLLSGRSALGKAGYGLPPFVLVFSGAVSHIGTTATSTNTGNEPGAGAGAEEASSSLSLGFLGVCYAIGYAFGIFCEHCGRSGSGSRNAVEVIKKSI